MFTNTTGKPIYVNADKTRVVEEGSPEAAFLLVGPEGQLPDEEAAKYGLEAAPAKAVAEQAAGTETQPGDAAARPSARAVPRAADKGK